MTLTGPLTWVIGAGGLLGKAVSKAYGEGGAGDLWTLPTVVPWTDVSGAHSLLHDGADAFLRTARDRGVAWRVLWCAGAGVVATSLDDLANETALLGSLVEGLGSAIDSDGQASRGSFFLSSSAGGVYGGSTSTPPFDESSSTGSLSAYGHEKLRQEAIVREFSDAFGVKAVIGRISNLYGPDQNPEKPQGLITHVGRATLIRQPLRLYVPLDTIRDYLFAPDAARLLLRVLARIEQSGETCVTRLIASESTTSVGAVLAVWRSILKRPPGVVIARNPLTGLQPPVLAFRSSVWRDLQPVMTPLVVGVQAVYAEQLSQLRAGRL